MFCVKCGKEIAKEAKYCSNCGVLISSDSKNSTSIKTPDKTPSISYQEFLKRKEQNRQDHFKLNPKKAKKSGKDVIEEKEVSIYIGLKRYVAGSDELKNVRGKSLPIRILPSAGPKSLLEKAVTKHENHNSSMMKGQRHVLLYPDNTEVINLPGSDRPFVLRDYREEVGKAYSRLTLFIALQSDFVFAGVGHDDMSLSSSDDETTNGLKSKCHRSDDDKDLLKSVFSSTKVQSSSAIHVTTRTCTQTTPSTSTSVSMPTNTSANVSTSIDSVKSSGPEIVELAIKDQEKEKCTHSSMVECPTCFESFPLSEIGLHADNCADIWIGDVFGPTSECSSSDDEPETNTRNTSNEEATEKTHVNANIKSIISDLASKCLTSSEQVRINIRRKNLWADFIEARKKHKLKPNDRIRVVFMGEPAIDDGGPKREFFSEILDYIKRKLFISGNPICSTVSLMNGEFRLAGEVMAMSIIQGGPAPNFLSASVYSHLVQQPLQSEHLEGSAKLIATKILEATSDDELRSILLQDEGMEMLEDIGYKGVPHKETLTSVDFIIQSLCVEKLISPFMASLMQLLEGLASCPDILLSARNLPNSWKPVFTEGLSSTMSAADFLDQMNVNFSLSQVKKEAEINAYKYFCDFMEDLDDDSNDCSVSSLLKWLTGSSHVPPLGFPKPLTVEFLHGCSPGCKCRPTASTCDIVLKLPVHINDVAEMKELMSSALNESYGFGLI